MNKKALGPVIEKVVFIIIILVFVSALFIFINRTGNSNRLIMEKYSRQIALLIDNAKTGMLIELDISELYDLAKKHQISINSILNIDNENRKIKLKTSDSNYYEYTFFSDNPILWNLDDNKEKIILEIK